MEIHFSWVQRIFTTTRHEGLCFSASCTHLCPSLRSIFAVRETASLGIMGAPRAAGAPLKPLRDDSALRALSTLRGLRGAPEVAPLCRETQSLGKQMLKEPLGINGLIWSWNVQKHSFEHCRYGKVIDKPICIFK